MDTGYAFVFGTEEQARARIGVPTEPAAGDVAVDHGMIQQFCAFVEDGNRSYWDVEFATTHWGGVPSPPAMLWTWCLPLMWTPDRDVLEPPLVGRLPLPGDSAINFSMGAEFRRPILVGERLSVSERLVELSPEKTTRLGTGHFITTVATFTSGGAEVGTLTNVLFRFTPPPDGADPPTARDVDPPQGEPIPGYTLPLTLRKLVTTPCVTLDYLPVHYDPEYAREQGHPTVFMNSIPLLGMVDRLVTDWAGPTAFVRSHHLRFATSLYAGDDVQVSGWVVDRRTDGDTEIAEVAVELRKNGTLACQAGATVALP